MSLNSCCILGISRQISSFWMPRSARSSIVRKILILSRPSRSIFMAGSPRPTDSQCSLCSCYHLAQGIKIAKIEQKKVHPPPGGWKGRRPCVTLRLDASDLGRPPHDHLPEPEPPANLGHPFSPVHARQERRPVPRNVQRRGRAEQSAEPKSAHAHVGHSSRWFDRHLVCMDGCPAMHGTNWRRPAFRKADGPAPPVLYCC